MQKKHFYDESIKYLNYLDKCSFFCKKKDGFFYLFSSVSTIILSIILIYSGLIFFPILAIILSILKMIFFKYFLYDEFKNATSEESSKFNYGLNIIFYFIAILISTIFFIIYFVIIYFYQYYKLNNNISKICFKIQFFVFSTDLLFGTILTIISQKIIDNYCRNYFLENDGEQNKIKEKVRIELSE